MEKIIPLCPNCNTPLEQKKGKYGMFWGCRHWSECGFKGYPLDKELPKDKPQLIRPEQPDPILMILDETRKINERLDKLANFLLDKLGK